MPEHIWMNRLLRLWKVTQLCPSHWRT